MSPVRTATRRAGSKPSRVRSSSAVFPEPGELIRFRQNVPFRRKRSRRPAAMRSFSFRTFRSRGTRTRNPPTPDRTVPFHHLRRPRCGPTRKRRKRGCNPARGIRRRNRGTGASRDGFQDRTRAVPGGRRPPGFPDKSAGIPVPRPKVRRSATRRGSRARRRAGRFRRRRHRAPPRLCSSHATFTVKALCEWRQPREAAAATANDTIYIMKAVVLRKPKVLEYVEVPMPELKSEEHVLIGVKACGICGSDLRYWNGDNPWALHTLGHHVDNPPNIVLGHEYAGVVVRVNSAKYEHLLGRRVGVQPYRVCGECEFCRSGRHNLCRETIHIGHGQGWGEMEFYPGAYAEYCLRSEEHTSELQS